MAFPLIFCSCTCYRRVDDGNHTHCWFDHNFFEQMLLFTTTTSLCGGKENSVIDKNLQNSMIFVKSIRKVIWMVLFSNFLTVEITIMISAVAFLLTCIPSAWCRYFVSIYSVTSSTCVRLDIIPDPLYYADKRPVQPWLNDTPYTRYDIRWYADMMGTQLRYIRAFI